MYTMTFTYVVLVRLLLFDERLPHSVRTKLFGSMSYFKNLISVLVFVPALANCQISPVICLNQGTGECYKVIFGDLLPKHQPYTGCSRWIGDISKKKYCGFVFSAIQQGIFPL